MLGQCCSMIIKVLGALFLIAAGISLVGESGSFDQIPCDRLSAAQPRRGYRASSMPDPSQTRMARERFRRNPMGMRLPAPHGGPGRASGYPGYGDERGAECGKDLPAARKVEVFFAPPSRLHHGTGTLPQRRSFARRRCAEGVMAFSGAKPAGRPGNPSRAGHAASVAGPAQRVSFTRPGTTASSINPSAR